MLAASIDGFLQFSAGDKLRHFLGRNLQRRAGLRIASGSRLARTYRKRSEADQCDFAALLQRLHDTIERRIESVACLDLGNLGILGDLID